MPHPHDGFGRRDQRPEPTDPLTHRGWNERGHRSDRRYPDDTAWSGPTGPRPWRGHRGPGGPGPDESWGRGGRPYGPGGPHGGRGFGGGFGGRGRRAGRGDIRAAVLLLLAEQPMHGYQLIQEIAQRTDGRWRPSPGAIYPALALLEDEGLVAIEVSSGRKLATLTEAGGTYVTEHADELGDPWAAAAERPEHPGHVMREAVGALAGAAEQVARTGTPAQVTQAAEILATARRDLYAVLAAPTT
jgi:DNA-binding PadR family transcriptional regulator